MNVLFIGKKNDFYCQKALEFTRLCFQNVESIEGLRGELFPEPLLNWEGDFIISYLSPWIIPAELLKKAQVAAINFHPGPPEYPGIGCTNFALYHEVLTFGVTCHHMAPKVDTGQLISVRRFPVVGNDTVWSLTQRCYSHILTLFYEVISDFIQGKGLPTSSETWQRKPYKRSELNALGEITEEMSMEEIRRRIRSVTFPNMPGAYRLIEGKKIAVTLEDYLPC